jgi:hypothetical protein
MLKRVPTKSWTGDARRQFFIENANSEKYYYQAIGNEQHNPHRNTLVPLGKFLGFVNYNRKQVIQDSEYFNNNNFSYVMRFSNPPYNAENGSGAIDMMADTLLYTDEPPAAGSVPLHYYDYIQMDYPTLFDENGRPIDSEVFPVFFGDGESGGLTRVFRPPGYETEQLRNSRLGAQNFVAKRGGKTRNRKNKCRKYKTKTKKVKKGGQPKDLIVGKKYTVCSNNGLFKGTLNKKIDDQFIFKNTKDENYIIPEKNIIDTMIEYDESSNTEDNDEIIIRTPKKNTNKKIDYISEIPLISFTRIGQSLEMPEKIGQPLPTRKNNNEVIIEKVPSFKEEDEHGRPEQRIEYISELNKNKNTDFFLQIKIFGIEVNGELYDANTNFSENPDIIAAPPNIQAQIILNDTMPIYYEKSNIGNKLLIIEMPKGKKRIKFINEIKKDNAFRKMNFYIPVLFDGMVVNYNTVEYEIPYGGHVQIENYHEQENNPIYYKVSRIKQRS